MFHAKAVKPFLYNPYGDPASDRFQEASVLTLNDGARKELTEYFSGKEVAPIRIFLANGCGGSHLGLALDEPSDADSVFKDGDFTFVADKDLLATTGSIVIDAKNGNFTVTAEHPLPAPAGGGCGGCCGGCGS